MFLNLSDQDTARILAIVRVESEKKRTVALLWMFQHY